jgi:hypothetical protein
MKVTGLISKQADGTRWPCETLEHFIMLTRGRPVDAISNWGYHRHIYSVFYNKNRLTEVSRRV